MNISRNFDLSEFACNDGTDVPAEYLPNVITLAKNLQVLRDTLKKPVTINSGYRSPAYNAKIPKASSKSQHLVAKAADIRVPGLLAIEVYNVILRLIEQGKMHNGGLGLYDTFVHYDVRATPARWDLRKKK
jgi:uncharacterized protein YcbK (DUF882 family)